MARSQNLAWAAGLFEGEGSIVRLGRGLCKRWQLSISSTDHDVLFRFHSIVKVGNFYGPYKPSDYLKNADRYKQFWRWCVSDRNGILAFNEMVGKYLGQRRAALLNICVDEVRTLVPKRRFRHSDGAEIT